MREIHIETMRKAVEARPRPATCMDELLALGTVKDGILSVEENKFQDWRAKYAVKKPPLRGMGDVVALIAKPIARVVDKVAGTDLVNCGSCDKRQDKLNAAVPFKTR